MTAWADVLRRDLDAALSAWNDASRRAERAEATLARVRALCAADHHAPLHTPTTCKYIPSHGWACEQHHAPDGPDE